MADEHPPEIPSPNPAPLLPVVRPRRERLPGTYAGNYLQDDPSPTAGAVVLCGLFALAFFFEAVRLFTEIISGFTEETDRFAQARIGLACFGLILLWVGVRWVRWILAGGMFFFGAGLLLHSLMTGAFNMGEGIVGIASILLGVVYLAMGMYTGFAANAEAFGAQQSTASGKAVSVGPVVVLCGLFLLGMLGMRTMLLAWQAVEQRHALAFADETVRALSVHWDHRAFDERADQEYMAQWPTEQKQAVFNQMAPWGAIKTIDEHKLVLLTDVTVDKFEWRGSYSSRDTFEHGHGLMELQVKRGLFSPWRVIAWSMAPLDRVEPAP